MGKEIYTDGKSEVEVCRRVNGYVVVAILPFRKKMFIKQACFEREYKIK